MNRKYIYIQNLESKETMHWKDSCWESPSNVTKCWWRCWTMTETLKGRFGSVHWYKYMGKFPGNIFNVKYTLTLWFSNSRCVVLPEHLQPDFITSPNWKQVDIHLQIYKLWCSHSMEYYIISERPGMCNNMNNSNKNTTQRKK